MASFFRLGSFCDECDAPSCAAGDGITPGCAWVGWEPDLLLRALDLGHLVWNRAKVCGVLRRWRRFTVVTKRCEFSSVGRHGVVHTGGVWLWMRKKPDVQRQVFMRHACAPTPPPRWPATHSTRRSTAGAANAPRAAFCHTSRARSPPTRASTPPLSCHPGQVAELPAPKALLPT